jgi:hypothetical protein
MGREMSSRQSRFLQSRDRGVFRRSTSRRPPHPRPIPATSPPHPRHIPRQTLPWPGGELGRKLCLDGRTAGGGGKGSRGGVPLSPSAQCLVRFSQGIGTSRGEMGGHGLLRIDWGGFCGKCGHWPHIGASKSVRLNGGPHFPFPRACPGPRVPDSVRLDDWIGWGWVGRTMKGAPGPFSRKGSAMDDMMKGMTSGRTNGTRRPALVPLSLSLSLLLGVASASAQVTSQLKQTLKQTYSGVKFHEVGQRVKSVYGVPLSRGASPREAANSFLSNYGSLFDNGSTPGGPDLRERFAVKTNSGKKIFGYEQYIDGVRVEGSLARVMVLDGAVPTVVFASGVLADRPEKGLGKPSISAARALTIAGENVNAGLVRTWKAPELIAIRSDTKVNNMEARLVWRCVGLETGDAFEVVIDAISGETISASNTGVNAHDGVISGSVTGFGSPSVESKRQPDTANVTAACPNPASSLPTAFGLVEILDAETGALITSTFADDNGDYSVYVPSSDEVTVRTRLVGPSWEVFTLDGQAFNPLNCAERKPAVFAATQATAPASGVNLIINTTPVEFTTAQVNAHIQMYNTWQYFKDRISVDGPLAGLDDPIEVDVNYLVVSSPAYCDGRYRKDGTACNGGEPLLMLDIQESGTCVNTAYSTYIAHEYGHYLLDKMLEIPNGSSNPPRTGFHEGYSDTVAFMSMDTEIFAEDFGGCGVHTREPLVSNPSFPVCSSSSHARGMLLGAIWLDLRASSAMTLEQVRQLHVDWSFIATAPENSYSCSTNYDQSADCGTLVEMLTADDDDGNLANGTPHYDLICCTFVARGILNCSSAPCSCGDSGFGNARYADCDRDGSLDVLDFLCFQSSFVRSESYACDCEVSTGRGQCDVFDFLCFQERFLETR